MIKIIPTKLWKIIKRKAKSWLPQKKSRFTALYNTALAIRQAEGNAALAKRAYRFLKGERLNIKVSPFPAPLTKYIQRMFPTKEVYYRWIQENEPNQSILDLQKKEERKLKQRPLISIITPVYNTDEIALEKMIGSVIAQTYTNWELCIVDGCSTKSQVRSVLERYSRQDTRIKVKFLDTNLGVSGNSNKALEMAGGKFIALLDDNDELAPHALYETVSLLNQHQDADMIYSDEDKLDLKGRRSDPYFKPDWSPDFFCSSMYTRHLGIYRKSLIDKISGFRSEFDGAQDYDLIFRLTEQTDNIYHIPKVLYHQRTTKRAAAATAAGSETKAYAKSAEIKVLSEHFQRLNIKAEIMPGLAENLWRVKRILSAQPKVSIIIPTRDQVKLLQNCVDSIQNLSSYKNYELIIVDNNSSDAETLRFFKKISKEPSISVLEYNHPFNFSAINNFAADRATGDLLLFLNNDTEVIAAEWLEAMIEHAVRPEVGAVGARLLYPNGMVQHAGVITGIGGIAGHSHKYFPKEHPGYFSRAKAIQNFSAVTAACMMVRKEVFRSMKGFNEENLAIAFNDIDFCLRLRRQGFLIIYTPYAELYHYESISRGEDVTPDQTSRFQLETTYMLKCWADILQHDPYYNPNLTLAEENFSISKPLNKLIA